VATFQGIVILVLAGLVRVPYSPVLFATVIVTYVVAPMRKAVFSHPDVTPAAARALDPGISWNAGRVPNSLALGLAAVIGLALLGLAIAQFRKTE
jgi:hypothetical protein